MRPSDIVWCMFHRTRNKSTIRAWYLLVSRASWVRTYHGSEQRPTERCPRVPPKRPPGKTAICTGARTCSVLAPCPRDVCSLPRAAPAQALASPPAGPSTTARNRPPGWRDSPLRAETTLVDTLHVPARAHPAGHLVSSHLSGLPVCPHNERNPVESPARSSSSTIGRERSNHPPTHRQRSPSPNTNCGPSGNASRSHWDRPSSARTFAPFCSTHAHVSSGGLTSFLAQA